MESIEAIHRPIFWNFAALLFSVISLSALCNQVLEVKSDLPSGVSTSPMQDMQDVVIEGTGQSVNSSTNSSECLLSFEEVSILLVRFCIG